MSKFNINILKKFKTFIFDSTDKEKIKWKTPLLLWTVSLALFLQAQPSCAMQESDRIHAEVERVLNKFHHNMNEYYERVKAKRRPVSKTDTKKTPPKQQSLLEELQQAIKEFDTIESPKQEKIRLDTSKVQKLRYVDIEGKTVNFLTCPTVGDGDCFFHGGFTAEGEDTETVQETAQAMRDILCTPEAYKPYSDNLKHLVYEHYIELMANNPNYNKIPKNIQYLFIEKIEYDSIFKKAQEYMGTHVTEKLPTPDNFLIEEIKENITPKIIKNWVSKIQGKKSNTTENLDVKVLKDIIYQEGLALVSSNPNHNKVPEGVRNILIEKAEYSLMHNYIKTQFGETAVEKLLLIEEKYPVENIYSSISEKDVQAYMQRFRKVGGGETYIPVRPEITCPVDILATEGDRQFCIFTFNHGAQQLDFLKMAGKGRTIHLLVNGAHYTRLYAHPDEIGECKQIVKNYEEYSEKLSKLLSSDFLLF